MAHERYLAFEGLPLEYGRPGLHLACGQDYPGYARVGRPHERTPVLNRPEHRHVEMLVRSGGAAEPGVVGDAREEVRPVQREPPDQLREYHLEAYRGPERALVRLQD